MSSTLSTAHPWIFLDMPQLLYSDDKTVRGYNKVFINTYPLCGYLYKANSQRPIANSQPTLLVRAEAACRLCRTARRKGRRSRANGQPDCAAILSSRYVVRGAAEEEEIGGWIWSKKKWGLRGVRLIERAPSENLSRALCSTTADFALGSLCCKEQISTESKPRGDRKWESIADWVVFVKSELRTCSMY